MPTVSEQEEDEKPSEETEEHLHTWVCAVFRREREKQKVVHIRSCREQEHEA